MNEADHLLETQKSEAYAIIADEAKEVLSVTPDNEEATTRLLQAQQYQRLPAFRLTKTTHERQTATLRTTKNGFVAVVPHNGRVGGTVKVRMSDNRYRRFRLIKQVALHEFEVERAE